MATADINTDYDKVRQLVVSDREVMWADQSVNEDQTDLGNSELDINKLVDFPVMTCVDTTRKSNSYECTEKSISNNAKNN